MAFFLESTFVGLFFFSAPLAHRMSVAPDLVAERLVSPSPPPKETDARR
jgi:hypothetical protein